MSTVLPIVVEEYTLVSSTVKENLMERVNKRIADGWQPAGPVQVSYDYHAEPEYPGERMVYVQTMFRYKREEK